MSDANGFPTSGPGQRSDGASRRKTSLLFLASFVALYFELVLIRYLSTEIRVFAYVQNLPLVASFLGLGVGMVLTKPIPRLKRLFPWLTAAIFLLIAHSRLLGIAHLPFAGNDFLVWGQNASRLPVSIAAVKYVGITLGITAMVVAFFVVLGKTVGDYLATEGSLRGYGVNLAGSLVGILAFTLISFLRLPPMVWVGIGLLALVPFFRRDRFAVLVFVVVILGLGLPVKYSFWSPYSHLELHPVAPPKGWPQPVAYLLTANSDFHQEIVDLSRAFVSRYPDFEPNHSALSYYDMPYEIIPHPRRVLIAGAGTGNDVAAAVRHGVDRIDAVEIDPVILQIGERYHPEHPYSSSSVRIHVNDARAFFHQAPKSSYDMVEFSYLDSHTLFASLSSLRLDNYVYTLQSFQEARSLLKPNGILVLAFDGGRTFLTKRLFDTLTEAFHQQPLAYPTGYENGGVAFVERRGPPLERIAGFPEISSQLAAARPEQIATDDWPFLYLKNRTIPISIVVVLLPFLLGAYVLLRDAKLLPEVMTPWNQHLFLLGAGFLLLETRAVTVLALLFGSTWIVNAVVISSFLIMALMANTLVLLAPVSRRVAYILLFASLGVSAFFPYDRLNTLERMSKVSAAGLLVGIPVFFSGMVFSRSFKDVLHPDKGLGINLLGAVVGGVLENLVTVGGSALLGYLAIVTYGLSVVALLWHYRRTPAGAPAIGAPEPAE